MLKKIIIILSIPLLFVCFAYPKIAFAQVAYEEDIRRQQEEWRQQQEMYRIMQEQQAAAEEEQRMREEDRMAREEQNRPQFVSNYFAIAFHTDSLNVWASWNHSSEEDAKNYVLNKCNKDMGNGCVIGLSAWNSYASIALNPNGIVNIGWGLNKNAAQQEAIKNCGDNFCKLIGDYDFPAQDMARYPSGIYHNSASDDDFPNSPMRSKYAIIVAPENGDTGDEDYRNWIKTGVTNYESEKSNLIRLCERATNKKCKIIKDVANGNILKIIRDDGIIFYLSTTDGFDSSQFTRSVCAKSDFRNCKIDTIYSSRSNKEFVDTTYPKSTRGYAAAAWTKKYNPNWNKIILSSGFENLQKAQADAIFECARQSNSECMLINDNMDNGAYFFIGFYNGSNGVNYFLNTSPANVENDAQKYCQKCTKMGIYDLRNSGHKVFDLR